MFLGREVLWRQYWSFSTKKVTMGVSGVQNCLTYGWPLVCSWPISVSYCVDLNYFWSFRIRSFFDLFWSFQIWSFFDHFKFDLFCFKKKLVSNERDTNTIRGENMSGTNLTIRSDEKWYFGNLPIVCGWGYKFVMKRVEIIFSDKVRSDKGGN